MKNVHISDRKLKALSISQQTWKLSSSAKWVIARRPEEGRKIGGHRWEQSPILKPVGVAQRKCTCTWAVIQLFLLLPAPLPVFQPLPPHFESRPSHAVLHTLSFKIHLVCHRKKKKVGSVWRQLCAFCSAETLKEKGAYCGRYLWHLNNSLMHVEVELVDSPRHRPDPRPPQPLLHRSEILWAVRTVSPSRLFKINSKCNQVILRSGSPTLQRWARDGWKAVMKETFHLKSPPFVAQLVEQAANWWSKGWRFKSWS